MGTHAYTRTYINKSLSIYIYIYIYLIHVHALCIRCVFIYLLFYIPEIINQGNYYLLLACLLTLALLNEIYMERNNERSNNNKVWIRRLKIYEDIYSPVMK